MEAEFGKQRDRCVTLVEEKEDEVAMLKANMELAFESAFAQPDTKAQIKVNEQTAKLTIKHENLTSLLDGGC